MIQTTQDFIRWCREQRVVAASVLTLYASGALPRWPSGAKVTEQQMTHLRRIVDNLDRLLEEAENG